MSQTSTFGAVHRSEAITDLLLRFRLVLVSISNKLTRLRDVLDSKKEDIDLLRPKMRKGHSDPRLHTKEGSNFKNEKKMKTKIPSESYGFISMQDAAQGTLTRSCRRSLTMMLTSVQIGRAHV